MLTLAVLDAHCESRYESRGSDFVQLDLMNDPFRLGDRIVVTSSEPNVELELMLDPTLGPSIVLLQGNRFEYPIPFDKKRKPYHPYAFLGNRIWGYVRKLDKRERDNYRNLALNAYDLKDQCAIFPHASTNSGATDERFIARCAIDGVTQTCLHGDWPYESWGINGSDDASLRIDFGRPVEAHELKLFDRADFPHDSWWSHATVSLSDGTELPLNLTKTGEAQAFDLGKRRIDWLELHDLVRGDDGKFPALSQIQVWGYAK